MDFLHAVLAGRLERVVGDVGGRQLLGRPAEDADDVDRDVADADDRDRSCVRSNVQSR
jgi:hypothetical protein